MHEGGIEMIFSRVTPPRSPRSGLKIRRPAAELLSRIDMKGTHRGNVERQTCLALSLVSLFFIPFSLFFLFFFFVSVPSSTSPVNFTTKKRNIALLISFAGRVTRDSRGPTTTGDNRYESLDEYILDFFPK